jgi:hypothetical protein
VDLIQLVEDHPGRIGGYGQDFFGILYGLVHRAFAPLVLEHSIGKADALDYRLALKR